MARAIIKAGSQLLLDTVFPPGCPSCHVPVEAMHNFCGECFKQLRMIAEPMCVSCGIPFTVAMEAGGQCPECLVEEPSFKRAKAVMVYDAISAPLVSSLKFRDQWAGLNRYVSMMQAAGTPLLADAELIVPVPLNWRRLWRRKYNQAALLAYGLSRVTGIACAPGMLVRKRATKPQMKLERAERKKNVRGAFAVASRGSVAGKHILLIDDVVTTGATVEACAEALLKAGAKQVDVLALARTVKE